VLGFQKAECCSLILFPGRPCAKREKVVGGCRPPDECFAFALR
jgi:hypothetical protein